ncbi:unnamed protein product [Penicillium manginii]
MSQRGEEDFSPRNLNQPPKHPPPLNSGIIPRDYLGSRSEVAARPGPPGSRHISPSPLHTSSLPKSQSQSQSHPQSYLHHNESPISQSPLSPRSTANPSPFSNRSPISRIANAPFPAPPSNPPHTSSPSPDIMTSMGPSDISVRPGDGNVAKPPGVAEPDRSASSSVSSMLSATGERPTPHRVMPRTSSIDSAISSLSSASQKSTFDASSLSPTDIGNLINAAGSAEAVIVHLLKEKHQAASQNSQLWKLVDKQRTLILGLNKDLERAFKEKERYKKKFQELQESSTPPVPSSAETSVPRTAILPNNENSPAGQVDAALKGSTGSQSTIVPRSADAGFAASREASSPITSEAQRVPQPNRKPPPAPLNLPLRSGDARVELAESDSDSDYGEPGEAERLSDERGRRKTREEDDRDREDALDKDLDTEVVGGAGYGAAASSKQQGTGKSASPATASRDLATRSPPTVGGPPPMGSILNSRINHPNGRPGASMPKSPGLPMSPRPEDRPIGSPLPRMPRDMASPMTAGFNHSGLPLSPRGVNYPAPFQPGDMAPQTGRPGGPIPMIDPTVRIDSPRSLQFPESTIYQGLVSDEYPGLLLPPNALPVIQVRVSSSRLRPSRMSYMASKPLDEEPVFTLSVISRSEMSELWRVEKVTASLPQLDQQVRQLANFSGKLPDRSIFSGHSPAKIDARRAALNLYFESLLDTPMDEKAALVICKFLTNDAIEPRDDETNLLKGQGQSTPPPDMSRGLDGKPRKEGYLTKRGKNFGGWKARYFTLHGPELKYFESPGGPHMGTIKLHHAQIGKQSQHSSSQNQSPPGSEEDAENQYRHAFLILEPKKKDSSALVRHVLCAESDEDRDRWVDALMEYVESPSSDNDSRGNGHSKHQSQTSTKQPGATGVQGQTKANPNNGPGNKRPGRGVESPEQDPRGPVQGFSFDDAVAADPPILGSSLDHAPRSPRIPAALSTDFRDMNQVIDAPPQSPKIISGPTNGSIIQDVGAWGNKPKTSTKEKKRSIWGFRTRSSFDLAAQVDADGTAASIAQAENKEPVRAVFGIPLAEAVAECPPRGVMESELPAVVYRCIEYLTAKDAALEEGIFRLSGSNVVIKGLKERFNNEGDVDFLTGDQYYDVHAVASLFKQYLRELPTTVLTRELHLDFLRVLELDDKQKKIYAFNALIHRLPRPNLSLLRALSLFLIEIVNNSDVNKMTVRNVGIVFAPTLNIPAPVFSMFLTDFESIFGDAGATSVPSVELTVDNSLSADDVRSPRHQMFSDIPTPSYNQTSFRGPGAGDVQHAQAQQGGYDPSRAHNPNDTGFISMQPSYDQHQHQHQHQHQQASRSGPGPDIYNQHAAGAGAGADAPFSSLNGMLSSPDDTRSAKTKRRESSMLFMENYAPDDYTLQQGR